MKIEICSSLSAYQVLQGTFNPYSEEVWVIALNSQLQVLGIEMIFRGTVDHCLLHPRDIFRFLVKINASSFILAHNHPSYDVLPSEEDLVLTRKIDKIGQLLEIPLNDHIIFSSRKYYSLADSGFFKKMRNKKQITRAHYCLD